MTDPLSDRPAYQQVADKLRQQIYSEQLEPGTKLPSESQLIKEFGVSRVTVRNAIKDLQAEGLIVTRQGRGSFVRDRAPTRRVTASRYRAEAEYAAGRVAEPPFDHGAGPESHRLDTSFREIRAPQRAADLLELTTKDSVLERQLVVFIDERPEQLSTSYLPLDLVRGTPVADPENEPWPGGTIAQLASLGQTVTRVEESVHARMPTQEEAKTLRIAAGVPVLVVTRRLLAADRDQPVEAAFDVLPADRVILDYQTDLAQ